MIYELHPTDSRKSFYGKAKVRQENNKHTLISYETEVCTYDTETKQLVINGYYSATTARHINSFISLFGFVPMSKKEIGNYLN